MGVSSELTKQEYIGGRQWLLQELPNNGILIRTDILNAVVLMKKKNQIGKQGKLITPGLGESIPCNPVEIVKELQAQGASI